MMWPRLAKKYRPNNSCQSVGYSGVRLFISESLADNACPGGLGRVQPLPNWQGLHGFFAVTLQRCRSRRGGIQSRGDRLQRAP